MAKKTEHFFITEKQNKILRKVLEYIIEIEMNKSGKVTISAQDKANMFNVQLLINKDVTF